MECAFHLHKSLCPSTIGLQRHLSSRTLTALLSSGWFHVQVRWNAPCYSSHCQKLLLFCLTMFQLISQYYTNGLINVMILAYVSLQVIKMCPPNSASQLCVPSSYRYNLIPHSIFYFPGSAHPKFQTPPWDCGFINNSSLGCKLT